MLQDYSHLTKEEHTNATEEQREKILDQLIAIKVCLETNDAVCGVAAAEISLTIPAYLVPQLWGQHSHLIENLRKEKKEAHEHGA